MELVKCPLCGKDDLKNNRALHAHMLKSHIEEYRAKDCKLSNFGIVNKPVEKVDAPDDLRPLDKSNPLEMAAYSAGYRFISGDECYTNAEIKKMGWF